MPPEGRACCVRGCLRGDQGQAVVKGSAIIIVKKKVVHGGRHGGAWKVAYADFVTAMMALFIVLWMMNASKQVQEAVGGYFKDPRGRRRLSDQQDGTGELVALKKEDMKKLKEDLLRSIHHLDPLDKLKSQIEITMTQEGLRIELMESAKGTFFELGSAKPTPALSGASQDVGGAAWQTPEPRYDRGAHRLEAVFRGTDTITGIFHQNEPMRRRRMMQRLGYSLARFRR